MIEYININAKSKIKQMLHFPNNNVQIPSHKSNHKFIQGKPQHSPAGVLH